MRRQVQVHFDNSGQFAWHEFIEDPCDYLEKMSGEVQVAYDEETDCAYLFPMSKVTAVIVSGPMEKKLDPWERTYKIHGSNDQHLGNT